MEEHYRRDGDPETGAGLIFIVFALLGAALLVLLGFLFGWQVPVMLLILMLALAHYISVWFR